MIRVLTAVHFSLSPSTSFSPSPVSLCHSRHSTMHIDSAHQTCEHNKYRHANTTYKTSADTKYKLHFEQNGMITFQCFPAKCNLETQLFPAVLEYVEAIEKYNSRKEKQEKLLAADFKKIKYFCDFCGGWFVYPEVEKLTLWVGNSG